MTQITPEAVDVTLRGRHRNLTRRLLIDAFAHVSLRDGLHEFSMQAVAEEAGCSLRTLYRYFPNREALIGGLNAEVQQFVQAGMDQAQADGSADLADLVERLVLVFAERRDWIRVWTAANLATDVRSSISRRVNAVVGAAIERVAPTLSPDEHARALSGLRQVVTSRTWLSLTDHLGPEEAARTAGWMVRALLADLASGGGPRTN
jgi:AcrR family transcriptional regulator